MQRFIIGTGRCGSTLLSTLMSKHPEALVLSEFFGGLDVINAFREGVLTGDDFAQILLQDHEISNLNRARAHIDHEILLDVSKYRTTRIPAIMLVCLPQITSDAEALFRRIIEFARARKPAPLSVHYPALFDWLTVLFNKNFWIERSGASSEFFPGQRRIFPDARYLHITRDGVDAAMSMYNMNHFITHVSFWRDPPADDEIERAILHKDQKGEDLISRRRNNRPHPAVFGQFWTFSVCLLLSEVKELEPAQYREYRFENLNTNPEQFLKDVCRYFEISSAGDWIGEAVSSIRSERNSRFKELSTEDQAALKAAVFPGNVLLKRAGLTRPNIELYQRIRTIWDRVDPVKAILE